MKILAIETSCDETAVAVIEGEDAPQVLCSAISSQIDLHRQTNGIVPEVAAREQLVAMVPMLKEALSASEITNGGVDAIAVTKGPGLVGSLLVGVETAKTLATLWDKPLFGIHHIEGHIYSAFAGISPDQIKFPVLFLVVSGGHTQLVLMRSHFSYEIVGSTRDDAAGEAFDKIARLLDLPYPGGPEISRLAGEYEQMMDGKPKPKFNLPRPMINSAELDFSFSGLKTAVLYKVRGNDLKQSKAISEQDKMALAWEAEQAIVDVLISKTKQAIDQYQPNQVALVGGVSANKLLREKFAQLSEERLNTNESVEVLVVPKEYSTDNAAMIGLSAWYRVKMKQKSSLQVVARPRLDLNSEE